MNKLRKRLPPRHILNERLNVNINSKGEVNYSSPDFPTGVSLANNSTNWTVVAEAYSRIFPSTHGRHLTSPKIHTILEHLATYIENHQHSLFHCNEQGSSKLSTKGLNKAFEKSISFPKLGFSNLTRNKIVLIIKPIDIGVPAYSTRRNAHYKRRKRFLELMLKKSETRDN
jgi:hypothetical protein